MFYRLPQWTTSYDDGDTVDVQYDYNVLSCVRLDVARVPCIVTLSKVVSYVYVFMPPYLHYIALSCYLSHCPMPARTHLQGGQVHCTYAAIEALYDHT